MPVVNSSEIVQIPAANAALIGDLRVPSPCRGVVIIAHGSGSTRFGAHNRGVADYLHERGFATLLLDLLTSTEESIDFYTSRFRFDVARLSERIGAAVEWTKANQQLADLPIGLFGARSVAAAALVAAARHRKLVRAVVSRGGRPDLAEAFLPRVTAPTLLIVGGNDHPEMAINRHAMHRMLVPARLHIVAGATHLFEEPGALQEVERVAADWFTRFLKDNESCDGNNR